MILQVKDVDYSYSNQKDIKILDQISAEFETGKIYTIQGSSGSGKTTLLSLLAGLDKPVKGSVLYEGADIEKIGLNHYRKHNISLVFQNYNLIDYLTPKENVMLGGKKNPEMILDHVGISGHDQDKNVLHLSGGQQQRVAIARALASDAKVLLADEPTGNLDETNARSVIDLLIKSAKKVGKCVIIVTHSESLAKEADVRYRLVDKKIYLVN